MWYEGWLPLTVDSTGGYSGFVKLTLPLKGLDRFLVQHSVRTLLRERCERDRGRLPPALATLF